jgi:hypothetical protein
MGVEQGGTSRMLAGFSKTLKPSDLEAQFGVELLQRDAGATTGLLLFAILFHLLSFPEDAWHALPGGSTPPHGESDRGSNPRASTGSHAARRGPPRRESPAGTPGSLASACETGGRCRFACRAGAPSAAAVAPCGGERGSTRSGGLLGRWARPRRIEGARP